MSTDFVWVAADGRTVELNQANGYKVLAGASGLDAPPVELFPEARTTGDGSVLVKRRTGVRSLALPIFVNTGGSPRTAVSLLADVFRGPGTLRVSTDGSTFRDLRGVYYETGLEGDEARGLSLPGVWRKVVVSLQAFDPWWYGDSVGQSMTLGGTTPFDDAVGFDDPVTLFNGGDSTVFTVDGHADAFPVWTITGPFTTLTVEVAGSSQFELAAPLAGGSTITVDSRPQSRGPSLDGGGVDWSLLTAGSRLPVMPTGSTSVSVLTTGTTGDSVVSADFEPRWLTP